MSSLLEDLFRRRALWVTGKGGTGKSTIAAALALLSAERGLKTLLIDVEANGDAARFLDAGPPRYEARQARSNLFHLALHPEEVLDEYLNVALKVPRVRRIGPIRRIFDFIATAAPGIKEVLIAGKVGFEERAMEGSRARWDVIVIDAAPSGQVVSHLRGPRTIQEIVGVGMIRNQTAWVQEILEDPEKTGVVVVSLPEEMPTTETAELLENIPQAVRTPVLAIVANRVVEQPSDADALRAIAGSNGDGAQLAVEAGMLLAEIAEDQAPMLERLKALGPPTAVVGLMGVEHHDLAVTKRIASQLEAATT
jgi:anion-transporting  ArsA/GET3 family ATPase